MNQISIIIVSWNACKHLSNCLDSIRQYGGSVVREVIVVDNASSDGSPEMIRSKFPEVILICSAENLGFARANNIGLEHASGTLFALMNSDTVLHPGCLQELARFLEQHSKVGLVGPKIYGADGDIQHNYRRLPTVWNTICRVFALDKLLSRWPLFSGFEMRHCAGDRCMEVEALSGCFWLANSKAVKQVGGLDEDFFFYAEDLDWSKRFRDAGWKLMFVPEAAATHYGGGSSSNAPFRYYIEMLRANLVYWKKHHGFCGVCMFCMISTIHHAIRLIPLGIMRLTRRGRSAEATHKFKENFICLRWFLTGRGV
jgi:GT2 family glycosyltransferase